MQKNVFRAMTSSAVSLAVATFVAAVSVVRPLSAQEVSGRCTTPDSLVVRGNARIADQKIRTEGGLATGAALNFPAIQRALKALYALNEFDDVQIRCDLEAVPEIGRAHV